MLLVVSLVPDEQAEMEVLPEMDDQVEPELRELQEPMGYLVDPVESPMLEE